MKIGIILTPDVRSKAYIQKSIKHNIHFENIILMNDNRKEQIFLPEVTKLSEKMGFNISETVKNNFTGFLVKPGNVDLFAESTEKLILNESLRNQFGINARIHVRDSFSISTHVKTIQNIYESFNEKPK